MRKNAQLDARQAEIKRNVFVIHDIRRQATRQGKRDREHINGVQVSLQEKLKKSRDSLWHSNARALPGFDFRVRGMTSNVSEIEGAIAQVPHRPNEIRAGVFYRDFVDSSRKDAKKALGISHLVGVTFASADGARWRPGGNLAGARVAIDPEQLDDLLHDVFLDILMFHARARLAALRGDLNALIEISRLKAKFAERRGLTSRYGNVAFHEGGISLGYFSFAAVPECWQYGDFKPEVYEKLWKDFEDFLDGSPSTPQGRPGERITVQSIRRSHRFGGQFSPRALDRALRALPEGRYMLVTPIRRPHDTSVRAKIVLLFGRKRWNQRMWKIVSFERKDTLRAYGEFLVIFPFEVHE